MPKFRTEIFDLLTENAGRFTNELKLQHLRPGEINSQDSGSLFNDIVSVKFSLDTSTIVTDDDAFMSGGDGVPEDSGTPFYVFIVAAIALLIVGFVAYKTCLGKYCGGEK